MLPPCRVAWARPSGRRPTPYAHATLGKDTQGRCRAASSRTVSPTPNWQAGSMPVRPPDRRPDRRRRRQTVARRVGARLIRAAHEPNQTAEQVQKATRLIRSGTVVEPGRTLEASMPFFGAGRFDMRLKQTFMNLRNCRASAGHGSRRTAPPRNGRPRSYGAGAGRENEGGLRLGESFSQTMDLIATS